MSTGFFAPEVRHSVQVRKPVKVWSSGALGGYVSLSSSLARHRHFIEVSTAPRGLDRAAPAPHPQRVAITVMAECESTHQPKASQNPTRIILTIDGLLLNGLAQDRADR
jgi:hypothetical protein